MSSWIANDGVLPSCEEPLPSFRIRIATQHGSAYLVGEAPRKNMSKASVYPLGPEEGVVTIRPERKRRLLHVNRRDEKVVMDGTRIV